MFLQCVRLTLCLQDFVYVYEGRSDVDVLVEDFCLFSKIPVSVLWLASILSAHMPSLKALFEERLLENLHHILVFGGIHTFVLLCIHDSYKKSVEQMRTSS